MTLLVKEIYYTLQGEGARTGRAAVFLRFAGCNLWSGLERDRAKAVCQFCDTDFVGTDGPGGGKFADAAALARAVFARNGRETCQAQPYVVCTGGEPLLQLDEALIACAARAGLRDRHRNQRHAAAAAGHRLDLRQPQGRCGTDAEARRRIEAVYPQAGAAPETYAAWMFDHFFLQPMDNPDRDANTRAATEYCLAHPQWRLSLQTHKLIGIR